MNTMNEDNKVIVVKYDENSVYCSGLDSVSHPKIYIPVQINERVICKYCGTVYIKTDLKSEPE